MMAQAITATFMTSKGSGVVRTIETLDEAEHLLKGGFGALDVEIKNANGDVIGRRWKDAGRWNWFIDLDAFTK